MRADYINIGLFARLLVSGIVLGIAFFLAVSSR
jgi:hypothetical protein